MSDKKIWQDTRLTEARDLRIYGKKTTLPKGMLGFLGIWESKAAAKRAGVRTKHLIRAQYQD